MAKKKETEQVKDFQDNRLVMVMLGAHDENVRRLEKKLDVSIKIKGNRITVRGETETVEKTFKALEKLYAQAAKKGDVDASDIDNALNVAAVPVSQTKENKKVSEEDLVLKTRKRHIQPRSQTQADYIRAMNAYEMVFGLGPAGTGKTFLAVAKAVSLMLEGRIDKIILTRPAVEAGENLGFLPGDLKEKIDPYSMPSTPAAQQATRTSRQTGRSIPPSRARLAR